jgi:hypothetical protein
MTFSSIWTSSDHAVIEGPVLLSALAMHSLHISLHGRLPIYYLSLIIILHLSLSTLVMHSLSHSLSLKHNHKPTISLHRRLPNYGLL